MRKDAWFIDHIQSFQNLLNLIIVSSFYSWFIHLTGEDFLPSTKVLPISLVSEFSCKTARNKFKRNFFNMFKIFFRTHEVTPGTIISPERKQEYQLYTPFCQSQNHSNYLPLTLAFSTFSFISFLQDRNNSKLLL